MLPYLREQHKGQALTETMRLWIVSNEATNRSYLDYILVRGSGKKLSEFQVEYGNEGDMIICYGNSSGSTETG